MWQFIGSLLRLFAKQAVLQTVVKRQPRAGAILNGVGLARDFVGSLGSGDGKGLLSF